MRRYDQMVNTLDKLLSHFLRCDNSLGVPESVCTLCQHTLVARDLPALELAEAQHTCSISNYSTHGD